MTVHDLLPNSSLLTVRLGRASLLLSQCATVATTSYLITGTPPPPGHVCQQDIVPFTVPLTSTASTLRSKRGARFAEASFP